MHPYPGLGPTHGLFLLPFIFLFGLLFTVLLIIPYWFIFKKAGFSEWLSLLMFVPFVHIIVLYVVAFSQWKVVPLTQVYPASFPPVYPPRG